MSDLSSIICFIIGVTFIVLIVKFYKFLILKCYKTVTRPKKEEETVNYNFIEPKTLVNGDVVYTIIGNDISRNDNKPISSEEYPFLIDSGYWHIVDKLSLQHALEYEKQSKNIKFHRTEKEEELSFQFSWNHGDEISTHVDSFEDCYALACEEDDLLKKIELLEKTIMRFEKAKKWFYRTKGGTIYFQDMYEHMHNSRNEDFSYIDLIKEDLDECTDQRDCVVAEILDLISSSSNGILQRDIYNIIPKEEIQGLIRELEHKGVIEKTKSGNSYLLTIKQPQ